MQLQKNPSGQTNHTTHPIECVQMIIFYSDYVGVIFTIDSAFWVLYSRGSGSWERCIHSGIFIVPPSRSAMMTSSCRHKPKANQKWSNESQNSPCFKAGLEIMFCKARELTSSWISSWNMECTPMMKGVGELNTSSSRDGRMGM